MKANNSAQPNKKLILHFDIEKIIRLPVRKNKELYAYDLCANWVWGRLQKNNKDDPQQVTGWKIAVNSLSKEQPEPELVNYSQYLKQYLKPNQEEWEKLILNLSKGPGSKAKGEIQKVIKNITLPKTLFESLRELNQPRSELEKRYLSDGKYEILPSFYKLFMWLKKNKREFAICIKASSKQSNHTEIIDELNLFFNGEHPLFNGKNGTPLIKMDGMNKSKNFVLEDSHYSIIYNYEEGQFIGSFGSQNYVEEKDSEMLKQFLKSNKKIRVCENITQIYSHFHSILAEGAFIYEVNPYKVLFIDNVDYLTNQIYFGTDAEISLYSCLGQKLESSNSFYLQVDQYELLRDVDYFIKKVEEKQTLRAQQITKIEKGEEAHEQVEEVGEAPQVSKQQSDAAYLKKNIVPILDGALRQVDLFRPEDPIGFIALYCLKNKDRIE